jgi:predicted  nucleic acid-binding Zn-ribbon protein
MEADDEYLRSCDDCGGRTAYYRTMEEADAAWNKPRYVAPAQPVDAETSRKDAARRLDIVATAILRGEPG